MVTTESNQNLAQRSHQQLIVVEPQALLCEGFKAVFKDHNLLEIDSISDFHTIRYYDPSKIYAINLERVTESELIDLLARFNRKKVFHIFYCFTKSRQMLGLARTALRHGVRGLVFDPTPEQINAAISKIQSGGIYLCDLARSLLDEVKQSKAPTHTKKLTARETEVLRNLADGKSNRDVAKVLDISVRTVETHRSRIMTKLQARSFADLVRYALENQIV